MTTTNYLAFDLGASAGRAIMGRFDGQTLLLEDVHRFDNGPIHLLDAFHWDALNLFQEMKHGLAKGIATVDGELAAVGIDTWGVDFGLLDKSGNLIGNPYHYRDSRTDGMIDKACEIVPREEIFNQTGIQFMQLNTLFQLVAMAQQQHPALDIADVLLFMPDLFNYWFTGQKTCEFTIASTSQCYNMAKGSWATELLEKLGLPADIFQPVIQPGTEIGPVLPAIAAEVGLKSRLPVIAPGCHDTASAVAAVPVGPDDKANYAYLSSGTWSLIGMEIDTPIINQQGLAYNVTNEGGVESTIRLLKNLDGLWLIQECRRIWAQQGHNYSYNDLTKLAAAAPPFKTLIDPDDGSFLTPSDMPARMTEFCTRTGQTPPDSHGAFIRCALESLAFKYRWVIEQLETLTGRAVEVLHIVGGGTQNQLLNQFAANATGRRVVTGPIEATAIGNILLQMLAVGQIDSLSQGREIVQGSFPMNTYTPQDQAIWDEVYPRFTTLLL